MATTKPFRTEAGFEIAKLAVDSWGTPLEYRMINRNSYKLISLGADKTALTPDDIVQTVTVSRPMVSTENKEEKPLNWRETRMIELLGEEVESAERERGGVPTIEFGC